MFSFFGIFHSNFSYLKNSLFLSVLDSTANGLLSDESKPNPNFNDFSSNRNSLDKINNKVDNFDTSLKSYDKKFDDFVKLQGTNEENASKKSDEILVEIRGLRTDLKTLSSTPLNLPNQVDNLSTDYQLVIIYLLSAILFINLFNRFWDSFK